MNIDLSQTEADALIAMHKHRIDEDRHNYPYAGHALRIPLSQRTGMKSSCSTAISSILQI